MLSALLSFITAVVGATSFTWVTVICAMAFWFGAVWSFRRMAKSDPLMTVVWRRHVGYRHHYPARSSVWRDGGFKC